MDSESRTAEINVVVMAGRVDRLKCSTDIAILHAAVQVCDSRMSFVISAEYVSGFLRLVERVDVGH